MQLKPTQNSKFKCGIYQGILPNTALHKVLFKRQQDNHKKWTWIQVQERNGTVIIHPLYGYNKLLFAKSGHDFFIYLTNLIFIIIICSKK